MRIFSAILIISSLLLLSFLGVMMPVHSSGHSSCLAAVLWGANCPPLISDLAAAIFHSQMFISLFSLILVANLVIASIHLLNLRLFDFSLNKNQHSVPTGQILTSLNYSNYFQSSRQWLVNLEHSPTF